MSDAVTLVQARKWLKQRPLDAHKGMAGRVLIVAGSRGMVGAGILAAAGAMRSGAGLVKLATVQSQQMVAAKRAPLEITSVGLPEDRLGRLNRSAWPVIRKTIATWRPDIIAVGPGLGTVPAVKMIVQRLLSQTLIPVVLDADGLSALATFKSKKHAPLIITPHEGEMARLMGTTPAKIRYEREIFAKKAALKFRCVCLLKGSGTLITDGRTVWKNTTGNPAMASGGMGDVLTGIIAALGASRELSILEMASLGAFIHGLAGDLAVRKFPERTLLASDLISFLPSAFQKIWRNL